MSECEYHNDDYYTTMNGETMGYSGLEIALCCKNATIRCRAVDEGWQDFVNINYCPMCR